MSSIRNSDAANEAGFTVTAVTVNLARRQLHISLGVAALMIAAAMLVVSTIGFAPREGTTFRAQLTVQDPQFVRPMTATVRGGERPFGG